MIVLYLHFSALFIPPVTTHPIYAFFLATRSTKNVEENTTDILLFRRAVTYVKENHGIASCPVAAGWLPLLRGSCKGETDINVSSSSSTVAKSDCIFNGGTATTAACFPNEIPAWFSRNALIIFVVL